MRLCVYLLEGKLYKLKKLPFAFLSSRGVIILAEELGGQFWAVLLLLRGFSLDFLSTSSRFSFGFSWVLHGFVTALAAQMLVNVGAGSPGRMLENDRVYTVYKPYKVTSLHARVYLPLVNIGNIGAAPLRVPFCPAAAPQMWRNVETIRPAAMRDNKKSPPISERVCS